MSNALMIPGGAPWNKVALQRVIAREVDEVSARGVAHPARKNEIEDWTLVGGAITHTDLPAARHHAMVNLFASSCENGPDIKLETLVAGRPALSTLIPMPEFCAGVVGYFPLANPKTICEASVRVLPDKSHKNELAAATVRRSADFDRANTSRTIWLNITGLVTQ